MPHFLHTHSSPEQLQRRLAGNSEMEENKQPCGENIQPKAAPAGFPSTLQEGLSFTPLDSNSDRAVQPFPRSPNQQRKVAKDALVSKKQLSRRMEDLEAESSRTEAHIQSLKKRKSDLTHTTETMKQKVQENFENMHCTLKQDEQAVLDYLELDLQNTRSRLDQILQKWVHHQHQVAKSLSSIRRAFEEQDSKGDAEGLSGPKRPEDSEKEIRLNEERFEKLLKTLSSVSKRLKVQLQRKTLLLDSFAPVIDRQTCHPQITVTSKGDGLFFTGSAHPAPEHPLQFDKACCALGSSPIAAGQRYWEVDVRCCSAWAVGVAYGSLERKGPGKGAKLGRNRNSWCVEMKNGTLSAWHNDRHVVCRGVGQNPVGKVGVWVHYENGLLFFYDADTAVVLQKFSAAVITVFDRAHHQFTEPLYPAIRFLKPAENQNWPSHLSFDQFSS